MARARNAKPVTRTPTRRPPAFPERKTGTWRRSLRLGKRAWQARPGSAICATLKRADDDESEPDFERLIEYAQLASFVQWAWEPGKRLAGTERTTPLLTQIEFVEALKRWISAGAPCPGTRRRPKIIRRPRLPLSRVPKASARPPNPRQSIRLHYRPCRSTRPRRRPRPKATAPAEPDVRPPNRLRWRTSRTPPQESKPHPPQPRMMRLRPPPSHRHRTVGKQSASARCRTRRALSHGQPTPCPSATRHCRRPRRC